MELSHSDALRKLVVISLSHTRVCVFRHVILVVSCLLASN